MIKEIRKIKQRSKANSIRALQERKLISRIINENGFVCYDTEEYVAYKKNPLKRGRPAINK